MKKVHAETGPNVEPIFEDQDQTDELHRRRRSLSRSATIIAEKAEQLQDRHLFPAAESLPSLRHNSAIVTCHRL